MFGDEAQYWLSLFYLDPNALNQPLEGEKWRYKAANNNHPQAQYDIASAAILIPVPPPIPDDAKPFSL